MTGQCTIALTDSGFDREVLQSEVPVLVDFWGEGCPPCRQLAPAIETLACEYTGKVKIGKLDVGANPATTMRYQVRTIPMLLLFKSGRVLEQRVGAMGRAELMKMIEGHL
ncbi:MAG: thioredoxin domain-containing protein [Ignavibacteriota bacterium]